MKKILAMLLAISMFAALVGCGSNANNASNGGNNSTNQTGDSEESQGPKTPEEMTAEDWENLKTETRELTIEYQPNAFTEEVWNILVEGFKEDHPNWTVELNLTMESADNAQAQILAGTPPVFFQPSLNFTANQAMEAGVLLSMEPVLDSPAYDEPGMTVRETLMPGFDKLSMKDGKSYLVPYRFGGNGIWYNAKMFRENGWEVPETYDDFMTLCEEIKSAGITPIMFTGTYAPYIYNMFLYPRICALDEGYQTSVDLANLVDGEWSGPNVKQALEEVNDMMAKGYLPEEGLGTDYLLAQQMFFEGKSAMVFCGTWLESEMKDSIPEGFEFEFMAPPVLENEDDRRLITAFASGIALCAGSGKEIEAMELTRYILSNKFMKDYAEKSGEPVITQVTADLDTSKFSQAGLSIYNAFNKPNTDIIGTDVMAWYPELYTNFTNGIIGTMVGNETIDNLLKTTEEAVQAIKADDSIVKYVLE